MKNKKGFTIIEVVLVLAIGGLIFLMVFIALPALQRSQRNTQREDDMARFVTAVVDFQSNNSGSTPFENGTTLNNFIKRYIDPDATFNGNKVVTCGDQFRDPDGECYYLRSVGSAAGIDFDAADYIAEGSIFYKDHTMNVWTNAKCGDSEGVITTGTGKRNFVMVYELEGGAIACVDNS